MIELYFRSSNMLSSSNHKWDYNQVIKVLSILAWVTESIILFYFVCFSE